VATLSNYLKIRWFALVLRSDLYVFHYGRVVFNAEMAAANGLLFLVVGRLLSDLVVFSDIDGKITRQSVKW
jgi:hypothetical protein